MTLIAIEAGGAGQQMTCDEWIRRVQVAGARVMCLPVCVFILDDSPKVHRALSGSVCFDGGSAGNGMWIKEEPGIHAAWDRYEVSRRSPKIQPSQPRRDLRSWDLRLVFEEVHDGFDICGGRLADVLECGRELGHYAFVNRSFQGGFPDENLCPSLIVDVLSRQVESGGAQDESERRDERADNLSDPAPVLQVAFLFGPVVPLELGQHSAASVSRRRRGSSGQRRAA